MKLLLSILLSCMLDVIPSGSTFVQSPQKRDSLLIADQVEYGFTLKDFPGGSTLALEELPALPEDSLVLVRSWKIDTLKTNRKTSGLDLKASVLLAPFESGTFRLPVLRALRTGADGVSDTLVFEPSEIEVFTMPVDTATFVIHDIKGQKGYPVTFREVLPYMLIVLCLAALTVLVVILVKRRRAARENAAGPAEPAYIIALRQLDGYKGEKWWAPEKQKQYYSGITDTLKFYIEDRFAIDAPEMTTDELFSALKGCSELSPELYLSARELFETADYVKFAKHYADGQEASRALGVAVSFVTSTLRLEEEPQKS